MVSRTAEPRAHPGALAPHPERVAWRLRPHGGHPQCRRM